MLPEQDGEDADRDQEQRRPGRDRRPVLPAFADDEGDEGRHGLRLAGGEEHGEGVFVPGEDQAEDRRRGNAGRRLRQHNLDEGLQARIAVDHRRFLVFARNLVDEALQEPDRERHVHGRIEQDHADLGIGQPDLAVHEVDRDRDRDRRHHARRQDEEEKVVLERHLEARESIGREHAEEDGEEGRAESDDDGVGEAPDDVRRPGDHHVPRTHQLVVPGGRGRQARHVFRRLPGARREQIDVALERRAEQHLRRIGDRVGRRLEARRDDPQKRDDGDQRVDDDDHRCDALGERRRLDDGMGGGRGGSSLLHPVQRLHVDVGEAEHGDEEDDGEGGRIAGLPAFERLALQRDGCELGDGAGAAAGQEVDHVEHLEILDAAEEHREHDEGQRHRQRDRPELAQRRRAVDLGGLVDVVGDRAQTRKTDQHHVRRPHPDVDDDDRPWREGDFAKHLERLRIDACQEGNRVVEQSDLRLIEELPEISDHGRRQHHRDQDHRGPESVPAEFSVDQVGESEADQRLEHDRPDDEMRGHLHPVPDVGIGQDALVEAQSDVLDLGVRPVRPVVGEREIDRPDQRKDIDRKKQEDRRSDEEPRKHAIGKTAKAFRHLSRRPRGDAIGQHDLDGGIAHFPVILPLQASRRKPLPR